MKKNKLFLLIAVVFMFSCLLFACDPIRLSGGPDMDETVYGNGGTAVVKGEYLYFANAFVDYKVLGNNDNKYERTSPYQIYGIYRTKLEDNRVALNDKNEPKNVELLTYNIGGFSYSGLYICGDYLYYATPYSVKDSSGATIPGALRFERVHLDGTSREIVYSVNDYSETCDYEIVYFGGTTYIVVYKADKSLTVVKCKGHNITNTVVASDVESFGVFEQNEIKYNTEYNDFNKYVYYTTSVDNNNYLYRVSLLDDEKEVVETAGDKKVAVVEVKNNKVYYTLDSCLYSRENETLDRVKYSSNIFVKSDEVTENFVSSYKILDSKTLNKGVVATYFDGTEYSVKIFTDKQTLSTGITSTGAITILFAQGNEFYYQIDQDYNIYCCRFAMPYQDSNFSLNIENLATVVASNIFDSSKIDFDAWHMFLFEQEGESSLSYLKMFVLSGEKYVDDYQNVIGQRIGILADFDK